MSTPLVSVWLITYNHEKYIRQAIEGVLMQQTNFAVQLVIGEDCSTDGTRAIVQEYKAQYPDRITLYLPERNMGMVPILRPTYALCTGKYVAMLDGDDYWTDPLKLQKQIDLMESDPNCHVSFHAIQIYDQSTQEYGAPADPWWSSVATALHLHDLIYLGNPIFTLSAIFRRPEGELPSYYFESPFPDLAMYYWVLAEGGTANFLPDVMGIYRIHTNGCFSSLSWLQKRRQSLEFFEKIRAHLPLRYHEQIEAERQVVLRDLFVAACKQKDVVWSLRYMRLINWDNIHVPVPYNKPQRLLALGLKKLASAKRRKGGRLPNQ
ncbi:glycosyltransferase family 2 protein [Hymenobacter latericus]|uniref:glycosyltransferase family 2 protein n=1 Tax=Hymenobacter sp. YIM 151858-1 TaxID=2987688 RepID=UPI0022280AC5|nr:glycosyltransferase [Hymenobacter sp. YIM 151858-1]UYZ57362.1 glycosyltransferase [Hymenobacter sp. YIM 151858-1]